MLDNATTYAGLERRELDADNDLWFGKLPANLQATQCEFEELWALHPLDFNDLEIMGRLVKAPRWQQAYEFDYKYNGARQTVLPAPAVLRPFLGWAQETVEPQLNGLLLNWYDGRESHYIGKHRDSTVGLVEGCPIVTISLGESRVFRMRRVGKSGFIDFEAANGTVIVIPWKTNLTWTHEVPRAAKYKGRRISITVRAFGAAR